MQYNVTGKEEEETLATSLSTDIFAVTASIKISGTQH